jgi:L-asparagine oxygenase
MAATVAVPTPTGHPAPWVVEVGPWTPPTPPAGTRPGDEAFVRAAGCAARYLPVAVDAALVAFADAGHPSGVLLLRGMPTGAVPATPPSPTTPVDKDATSEFVLLTVARRLGQPVGYAPEHGGDIVQNLVPVAAAAGRQVSTSASVELEFHTETAFHPHKPRFLVLSCLRGDPAAATLVCSIDAVLTHLSATTRAALAEPRFRTAADESFRRDGAPATLGAPMAVLAGDPARPVLTFDADLMVGVDAEAEAAIAELRAAVRSHAIGVVLEAGDVLVVDNHAAVHGRSPFPARYDGTDRWLQRSFVVADLSASSGERVGRVVTTTFG